MKHIIYEVHSDVDENNDFQQFVGRGSKQAAIAYAKSAGNCWVDKLEYDDNLDSYDYLGGVWNYSDEN